MEGGHWDWREGSENILLCGRQNPPALGSGHLRLRVHCFELGLSLLHWEPSAPAGVTGVHHKGCGMDCEMGTGRWQGFKKKTLWSTCDVLRPG